ncbi:protein nanos isoform X1 [Cryptotermes secundus]|nr:protein nanos isoform X1 [Cryptotermes secundus]XP_033607240.1 protein nanos isoform X1 [Cryptotermes secundus]
MSSQLQAASVMAGNNSCIAQQYSCYVFNQNISDRTSVQPCANTQLPETLYSNVENSSNNEITPTLSSSEEMSYEKFSTKEMCMISEMTPLTPHGHTSSASETSNTTNKQNEWKQTEYFYIKRQEEKQSFQDSHAPVTSCNNGSAHGARPKAYSKTTVTASRTSVSEDVTNWALPSEGSEGRRQWCSFCAKNGEPRTVVMSHTLYNSETNTLHCPILRAHHCEVCNATGDFAHTRSYCPRIRMLQGDMESTITALKSTRRQASGKVRNNKAIMKLPK